MAAGFQSFGPSGEIWMDTNFLTTRVVGQIIFTDAYPNDPIDNTGAHYRDYGIPVGTFPWATGSATNGKIIQCSTRLISTGVARLTYIRGAGPAVFRVTYGWGPQSS